MTRENKLALIIGFTLILMVGVLVSDHLSRARMAQLDETTAADTTGGAERTAFSGRLLDNAIQEAQRRGQQAPVATRIEAATPTPSTAPGPAPAIIQQGSDGLGGSAPEGADTDGLGERFRAWAEATGTAWERWNASAVPPEQTTTIADLTVPADRPAGSIPTSVTHTVVANDSLYRLAERYLGDGNRWHEIRRANADRVGPDGGLSIGTRLKISLLEPVNLPRETVTPRRAGGAPSEYVVRPGDTLSEIAGELLGSARRADEIMTANPGLESADKIAVGMKLTIPVR